MVDGVVDVLLVFGDVMSGVGELEETGSVEVWRPVGVVDCQRNCVVMGLDETRGSLRIPEETPLRAKLRLADRVDGKVCRARCLQELWISTVRKHCVVAIINQ